MRKFLLLIFSVMLLNGVFATSISKPPGLKADAIYFLIGNEGEKISLKDLAYIKVKDFEILCSKKFNFFEKINFKIAQNKIRKEIDKHGFINDKQVKSIKKRMEDLGSFFAGFALGLLLGPLGVIISYFFKDDNRRDRISGAWKGFLVAIAIVGAIIIAGF